MAQLYIDPSDRRDQDTQFADVFFTELGVGGITRAIQQQQRAQQATETEFCFVFVPPVQQSSGWACWRCSSRPA